MPNWCYGEAGCRCFTCEPTDSPREKKKTKEEMITEAISILQFFGVPVEIKKPSPSVVIISKYQSTCTVCEGSIYIGEKISWKKGSGARHFDCKPTQEDTPF